MGIYRDFEVGESRPFLRFWTFAEFRVRSIDFYYLPLHPADSLSFCYVNLHSTVHPRLKSIASHTKEIHWAERLSILAYLKSPATISCTHRNASIPADDWAWTEDGYFHPRELWRSNDVKAVADMSRSKRSHAELTALGRGTGILSFLTASAYDCTNAALHFYKLEWPGVHAWHLYLLAVSRAAKIKRLETALEIKHLICLSRCRQLMHVETYRSWFKKNELAKNCEGVQKRNTGSRKIQ